MTLEQRCTYLISNALGMLIQEVLTHAHLSRLVTNPVLLVIPVGFEALTSSANMTCLGGLAHHTATLSSVIWILGLPLLCGSRSSQMP